MAKQKNTTGVGRPNLRTIAEHINLSPATVSLALRGDTRIPLGTRERVLAAAEEMNYEYVPRTKKTAQVQIRRVAFVMHDYGDHPVTSNPFYGHILSGAEQVCREQHVSLSFVIVQHTHAMTDILPPVLTHDADGILLASPYPVPLVKRISRESECPIVLIDSFSPGCIHDSVMADDFGGAYQLMSHLFELGHEQIAVLTSYARSVDIPPSFQERYRGYTSACTEREISPHPPIVIPGRVEPHPAKSDIGEFTAWVKDLLKEYPNISAFFGVSDRVSLSLITALRKLGIAVPKDISVAGFDDIPYAKSSRTPLTTLHSYRDHMAAVAVERLLARIKGDDRPPQYIKLGVKLVVRESTGPIPNTLK